LSVSEITVPEESFRVNLNISALWRTIKTILPDMSDFAGILTPLKSVDKYAAECHDPPPYRTMEKESLEYAKSVLPLFVKVTSNTSQVLSFGGRNPTQLPIVFAEFMVTLIPSFAGVRAGDAGPVWTSIGTVVVSAEVADAVNGIAVPVDSVVVADICTAGVAALVDVHPATNTPAISNRVQIRIISDFFIIHYRIKKRINIFSGEILCLLNK
jgi:hypothetical protein